MEKYCTKCRNKLKNDIKFCTSCGFKVEGIKEEPESIVEQFEPIPPVKKEKRKPEPTPPKKEIPLIIQPEPTPQKQSKPVDKIIIPAILVALILSIAAIILSFAVGGEAYLSKDSVDTEALASNSVTTEKIVDGTITDDDIIVSGLSNIANTSINGDHIIDNVIDFRHLSNKLYDAITGINEIANGSITSAKIADFSIRAVDLANDSVTSTKIAEDSVRSSEIANGAIATADISDNAVTYAKMDIKIRFGIEEDATNRTLVNHGLGSFPESVILTPIYEENDKIIHANVYDIDGDSFRIGLWEIDIASSTITEVTSVGVNVYWMAIR